MCTLQTIESKSAPKAIGPYSQGVMSDTLIFTSGQLPICPSTGLLVSGLERQTSQSLANIKAVLEQAESAITNIVKVTVYLDDIQDFPVVNEIYHDFFVHHKVEHFPARTCFEVSKLPMNAKIEIEAIAVKTVLAP
ncbi:Rid family detoxifying hydrolase [Vibrio fortis]|jgi:2-iminobutanoate/2-iminopropanoate deaminase|uniref:Rid family detoxifying hydrolase n=1 Tax=Vibrio fortis TaxID=212667 RepID=UPI0040678CAE